MTERINGYYIVRYKQENEKRIAEYIDGYWYCAGVIYSFRDEEFTFISKTPIKID
jgi:hypothetical protein